MNLLEKKYYKYDKIYRFKESEKTQESMCNKELSVLTFAWKIGYARKCNDYPKKGKVYEYFEILKFFDYLSLRNKMDKEASLPYHTLRILNRRWGETQTLDSRNYLESLDALTYEDESVIYISRNYLESLDSI